MSETGINSGKNRTTELMGRLIKATSIKRFISINISSMEEVPFHEYIRRKCLETGVVQEHVIKRADIERTYGHQLFRGLRVPSRDKVIQLAFGFGFSVEETQSLLKAARKSVLYPKIKRDAVILFCINRGMSVIDAQEVLEELGLPLLGEGDRFG
jgi:transcriptional regulator with XRE-family HTH domain